MKKFFGLFFVVALASSGLLLSCSDETDSLMIIPAMQDSDYTVTADADSIVETINNLKKSGTVKANGEFYFILIGRVRNALNNLREKRPNVMVTLDLSAVTGWTDLSFSSCTNLRGIVLPAGVTSIGDSAFDACTKLTSVTIPSSVTSICDRAFRACVSLASVTIPSSVTSIGDSAFYGCSSLSSVTIPSSVTSIGDSAFCYCSSLASVTVPSSVTSVGYSAFLGCKNLSVNYTGTLAQWCNIKFGNGDAHNSSGIPNIKFCVRGQEIKELIIPNGVTSIGYCAFYGCAGLASVTIPSGVTSIGCGAFCRCTSIKSVMIPNSVTSIDVGAFNGCERLATW